MSQEFQLHHKETLERFDEMMEKVEAGHYASIRVRTLKQLVRSALEQATRAAAPVERQAPPPISVNDTVKLFVCVGDADCLHDATSYKYCFVCQKFSEKQSESKPVTRFKVKWVGDRYFVSIPNWDGGEVVLASDYDALASRASRPTRPTDAPRLTAVQKSALVAKAESHGKATWYGGITTVGAEAALDEAFALGAEAALAAGRDSRCPDCKEMAADYASDVETLMDQRSRILATLPQIQDALLWGCQLIDGWFQGGEPPEWTEWDRQTRKALGDALVTVSTFLPPPRGTAKPSFMEELSNAKFEADFSLDKDQRRRTVSPAPQPTPDPQKGESA